MTAIDIPFHPQMEDTALNGWKCCTSRSEPKGTRGDVFHIKGIPFRIIDIEVKTLNTITYLHYRHEGFDSPDEFVQFWKKIHRGNYTGPKKYYLHWFARALDSDWCDP